MGVAAWSSTFLLVSVFVLLGSVVCQEDNLAASCAQQEKCGACIQTFGCAWCSQMNLTESVHCLAAKSARESCPDHVVDPSSKEDVIENSPFSKPDAKEDEQVQLRPQRVKLRLRVGQEYELPFFYKQAKDYPVDLYYLMDLSGSMEDDKNKLSALGDQLAKTMQEITGNFRIGFGSFVDKVIMPFVSTIPEKLKKPCNADKVCAPPYSFINHMPLSNRTREFSIMVNDAVISGNLDTPEGGFDALMQAMVCTKDIGWRPNARHLLVFSTDASFHLAGDGKLAGIVRPNDEQCHMVNGQFPNEIALKFDYPSISQLNIKAQQNNMNLIFAVTATHDTLYKDLSKRILGASSGILDGDSSNVIGLVADEYKKLVNSVKMLDINDEIVSVQYLTNCLDPSAEMKPTSVCNSIRVNNTIHYTARIKVSSCPINPAERTRTLRIKPEVGTDKLDLEIEIICDCPCEADTDDTYQVNAPDCHGGIQACGVCDCSSTDGRKGKKCQCEKDRVGVEDEEVCRGKDGRICSDRGVCNCGVCECRQSGIDGQRIYGPFCECDNYLCLREGGKLCSGPSQGTCECGKCKCKPGWAGERCSCLNNTAACFYPGSPLPCSGKGECVCGECQCSLNEDNVRNSGPYCEQCPSCPPQRCTQLEFCVACQAYKSTNKQCEKCNNFEITTVETLGETSKDEHKCLSSDENDCRFEFIYKYDGYKDVIRAQKQPQCAKTNVLAIGLGVTGGTLLLGLLILIAWKIFTSIHDGREYVKFEKERALSKFDRGDNPLYKPSTVTFSNPTFGNN